MQKYLQLNGVYQALQFIIALDNNVHLIPKEPETQET